MCSKWASVIVTLITFLRVARSARVASNTKITSFCHLQRRSVSRTTYNVVAPNLRIGQGNRRISALCASTLHRSSCSNLPLSRWEIFGQDVTLPSHSTILLNASNIELDSDVGVLSISPQNELSGKSLLNSRMNDSFVFAGILAFLTLSFSCLLRHSPPGCWRYFMAGGICASTSHAITTPIDVVKTRQQVDPWLQEKSMWQATLEIVRIGGPFALLSGLGPTFIGYLMEGGVKFGIYEVSKPATRRLVSGLSTYFSYPALDSKILSLVLCGIVSGAAASMMLSPMEALRIRMVSDAEFSDKNSVDAVAMMVKNEGIQSLLKGFPAMLLKQVPYTITKNASFDLFTTWLYRIWKTSGHAVTANSKIAIPLISAISAAVLSCVSSHPGDMLLSLVNAHEGSRRTRDFARDILNGKGVRGFFVGIKPRFLHVLLIVTVQLMIYDCVKRLVGIAATGTG